MDRITSETRVERQHTGDPEQRYEARDGRAQARPQSRLPLSPSSQRPSWQARSSVPHTPQGYFRAWVLLAPALLLARSAEIDGLTYLHAPPGSRKGLRPRRRPRQRMLIQKNPAHGKVGFSCAHPTDCRRHLTVFLGHMTRHDNCLQVFCRLAEGDLFSLSTPP